MTGSFIKNLIKLAAPMLAATISMAGIAAAASAADRDESKVIAEFRGDTPDSDLSISYADLTKMLDQTVMVTGMSNRARMSRAKAGIGTRIIKGGGGSARLEGNRLDFHSYMGDNLKAMKALRDDLASVPSLLPLKELNRDEQLAYWLNLYNVTLIAQIGNVFPESNLKKFYFGSGDKGLWKQKVVTVAGVPLSLNDIQHKIIIPKYQNPLVMYGLFQGVVGSPNIRDEAFTGDEVWTQLKANAREFINSNRGAFVRERILRTSYFYRVNEALFPNFNGDMRRHLLEYAKPNFADKIMAGSSVVGTGQSNWYIADLYGGNRAKSSANTSSAAFLGAFETGSGAGAAGDYGGGAGGAIESAWVANLESRNMNRGRFPIHVIQYLHKMEQRDRKVREGEVGIEELENGDRIQGAKKKAGTEDGDNNQP